MKKILFTLTVFTIFVYPDLSMDQIRNMIIKIHEKREGIGLEKLEKTKNIFLVLKEKENNRTDFTVSIKVKETKLVLHGILNGTAYINNEWVHLGGVIGGYTLKYIGKQGVVLRDNNQIKKLFFKERKNFIMMEERK